MSLITKAPEIVPLLSFVFSACIGGVTFGVKKLKTVNDQRNNQNWLLIRYPRSYSIKWMLGEYKK